MSALLQSVIGSLGGAAAPSEVEATWNPSDKHANVNLTNSNRTAQTDGAASSGFARGVRSTKFLNAGKIYCEFFSQQTTSAGGGLIGMANSAWNLSSAPSPNPGFSWGRAGFAFENGLNQTSLGVWADNTVFQLAVDLDANLIWWGRNGTWLHSGNPSAGTGGRSITADTNYAVICAAGTDTNGQFITIRSLTADFSYSIPSGFVSLAAAEAAA